MDYLQQYAFEIAFAALFIYFSIRIALLSRQLKAYRKLTRLMEGGNLEELVGKLDNLVRAQGEYSGQLSREIGQLRIDLAKHPHNLHLVRFNAFGSTGSDLSFSLAMVDDAGDGVVLSSIYGREESRIFAKPLRAGKSEYTLSDEEKQAVKMAMSKHN